MRNIVTQGISPKENTTLKFNHFFIQLKRPLQFLKRCGLKCKAWLREIMRSIENTYIEYPYNTFDFHLGKYKIDVTSHIGRFWIKQTSDRYLKKDPKVLILGIDIWTVIQRWPSFEKSIPFFKWKIDFDSGYYNTYNLTFFTITVTKRRW